MIKKRRIKKRRIKKRKKRIIKKNKHLKIDSVCDILCDETNIFFKKMYVNIFKLLLVMLSIIFCLSSLDYSLSNTINCACSVFLFNFLMIKILPCNEKKKIHNISNISFIIISLIVITKI